MIGRGCEVELQVMITTTQIRAMIQQVTLFKISLDDFEEWLTAASWSMHQDSEPEAVQLVGKIELGLAEVDAGHKSYADLLRDFASLAGMFEIGCAPAIPRLVASSSARSFPFNFRFELSEDVDKRYGMGFSYTPLLPT